MSDAAPDAGISTRVKAIVSEHLGSDADEMNDSDTLEDLGSDSLDTVEIVMGLEEEFNCEISDAQAEKFLTVGDLIDFVREPQSTPSEVPSAGFLSWCISWFIRV